jgi:hypothetical protein
LGTTKRAVREQTPIFSGKWNTLSDTLVNDIGADLCESVNIGFPGSKISPLDGIVKEAMGTISIILVIFSGINPSLGCDGMSPSGRVLITKTVHIVSKFSESRGCRSPGQTGTYNNDPVLSLVCRVNQFGRETMVIPLFGKGSLRYFGIEIHSNVLGLIP